jgi:hypothetical protein
MRSLPSIGSRHFFTGSSRLDLACFRVEDSGSRVGGCVLSVECGVLRVQSPWFGVEE